MGGGGGREKRSLLKQGVLSVELPHFRVLFLKEIAAT